MYIHLIRFVCLAWTCVFLISTECACAREKKTHSCHSLHHFIPLVLRVLFFVAQREKAKFFLLIKWFESLFQTPMLVLLVALFCYLRHILFSTRFSPTAKQFAQMLYHITSTINRTIMVKCDWIACNLWEKMKWAVYELEEFLREKLRDSCRIPL